MANKTVSQLVSKEIVTDTDFMLIEDEQMTCNVTAGVLKSYITKEIWAEIEKLKAEIDSLKLRIEELENSPAPTPPEPEQPDPEPPIEDAIGFATNIIYGYYMGGSAQTNAPASITVDELNESTTQYYKLPIEAKEKTPIYPGGACPDAATYFVIIPETSNLNVTKDNGIGGKVPFDEIQFGDIIKGCNGVSKVLNGTKGIIL